MGRLISSWNVKSTDQSRRILVDTLRDPQVILAGFNDPLTATGGVGTVMRAIERHLARFHLVFWNPLRARQLDMHGRWLWPVQLSDELVRRFQRTFLKQYVWPCLHGLQPAVDPSALHELRLAMSQAGDAFVDSIVDLVDLLPADRPVVVWINDYALAWFVASLRTRLNPSVRIGISFRCPFGAANSPALEAQDAVDLISNLSSADFVTFHRARDVEHFLDLSMSLEASFPTMSISRESGTIHWRGHVTYARAVPMGNDPEEIQQLAADERTSTLVDGYQRLANHARIVASVSRLEPHKGILQELRMISSAVAGCPSLAGTFSLIRLMPVPPEYEEVPVYQALLRDVRAESDWINATYGSEGWTPVHLLSGRVYDRHEVVALLRAADVVVVLSHSDGFSHIPLEALLSKQGDDPCPVLLLSDVGVADYLPGGFVKTNPASQASDALGNDLRRVLAMPTEERHRLFEIGRSRSRKLTAHQWAVSCLTGIARPELLGEMNWQDE